jgi:hypothetical protein
MSRNDANHKANQSNPQHSAWQKATDNTSNQRNPNNPTYRQSRQLPPNTKK